MDKITLDPKDIIYLWTADDVGVWLGDRNCTDEEMERICETASELACDNDYLDELMSNIINDAIEEVLG